MTWLIMIYIIQGAVTQVWEGGRPNRQEAETIAYCHQRVHGRLVTQAARAQCPTHHNIVSVQWLQRAQRENNIHVWCLSQPRKRMMPT